MKASIDPEKCTGHGLCYMTAPDVFVDDDQGHGQVRDGEVAVDHQDQARQGTESCPERAISLS